MYTSFDSIYWIKVFLNPTTLSKWQPENIENELTMYPRTGLMLTLKMLASIGSPSKRGVPMLSPTEASVVIAMN